MGGNLINLFKDSTPDIQQNNVVKTSISDFIASKDFKGTVNEGDQVDCLVNEIFQKHYGVNMVETVKANPRGENLALSFKNYFKDNSQYPSKSCAPINQNLEVINTPEFCSPAAGIFREDSNFLSGNLIGNISEMNNFPQQETNFIQPNFSGRTNLMDQISSFQQQNN